jgi:hypothetical protein
MIPRSINKRTVASILDEWELKNDNEIQTSVVSKEHSSDSDEEDNDSEKISEIEYQNLRESIDYLCEENKKLSETAKKENYEFCGLELLQNNIEDYFFNLEEQGRQPSTVHICAYHINSVHKHPFLEYFLFKKNKENNEILHFPRFEYTNNVNVVAKGLAVIELLSMSYYKTPSYVFTGYTNDDDNLYLFFDCSGLQLDGFKMSRMNDLWMVTIDELINHQSVCNFPIEDSVTEFFNNNLQLLFLKDNEGKTTEIPSVMYAGVPRKDYSFANTFGVSPAGSDALMGNYYYFTDYQNAIKKSGWLNESAGCGCLIRCAVFLDKMKFVRNNPNDKVDESKLTKDILLNCDENSAEYKNAKLLLRVSDRDGLWTKEYNSVYLGKMELDDGTIFNEHPLWVVKDYEQQVVLSTHIIDKKSLDSEWKRDSVYFVL